MDIHPAFHGIDNFVEGRKVLINGTNKEYDGNNDGQLSKENLMSSQVTETVPEN